ncbi:H-NS family nucleoid-associated regulatory protein [Paraburkholderia hospita]
MSREKYMDERKRESIVAYLRRRMTEFGTRPEDIAVSMAADTERLRAIRYRDAFGHTWDGRGASPQWIIQATSAGQSLEHFVVERPQVEASDKLTRVKRCDDPFAGTRLASIKSEGVEAA